MSIIEKLTEGVVRRNVQKEGAALLDKWEKTGLLEGINSDHTRNSMAALLENQAKELLRESSTMASGDVEGFAAVAFPIVRRVFGGLIANELVSVQPMSLPSGLIFFLDFTVAAETPKLGYEGGDSLYGGDKVGQQITGGVDLSNRFDGGKSFYNLNNGYGSATGSAETTAGTTTAGNGSFVIVASGTVGEAAGAGDHPLSTAAQNTLDKLVRYDPDLSGSVVIVGEITGSSDLAQFNVNNLVALDASNAVVDTCTQVRRLTQIASSSVGSDPSTSNFKLNLVFCSTASAGSTVDLGLATSNKPGTDVMVPNLTGSALALAFPIKDNLTNSTFGNPGGIVGATEWELEGNTGIPEIDIKVDSVSITAATKKLKAKWTPELQQDINAYHNLDAEVELTSILSEQIALEIDQEILEDLIKGAKAGTYYWSRKPGKFVNRTTGASINESLFPDFTGTVSEWYETLLETVNDVSAQIHRKTLRGGANFIVVSPEVANILEFTAGFRADTTADENRGTAGAVKIGQLSKKLDIYVDPYFPRNVVLVGRKGNSFLESGYVYAPYVPLQVTPTIFGPEDFVPRKGVMTRYGKKMVRPDMYGLVICEDLLG
jgi:hypothetical protein